MEKGKEEGRYWTRATAGLSRQLLFYTDTEAAEEKRCQSDCDSMACIAPSEVYFLFMPLYGRQTTGDLGDNLIRTYIVNKKERNL